MLRSACGAITTAAASVLLAGSGSCVALDAVALFANVVPAAARWTRTTTVGACVAPAASVPMTQVTVAPAAVQSGEETKLHPAGSTSLTCTAAASLGPLLVTASVNVTVSPTDAFAELARFCIARSAAVPTDSRSDALLLESTGSGSLALPAAVFSSVVPAAAGRDVDRDEHGERRPGRERPDVAGDDVAGAVAGRGLIAGHERGARGEWIAQHGAGRGARPEVPDRQQHAHVAVRRRRRDRRERVGRGPPHLGDAEVRLRTRLHRRRVGVVRGVGIGGVRADLRRVDERQRRR